MRVTQTRFHPTDNGGVLICLICGETEDVRMDPAPCFCALVREFSARHEDCRRTVDDEEEDERD